MKQEKHKQGRLHIKEGAEHWSGWSLNLVGTKIRSRSCRCRSQRWCGLRRHRWCRLQYRTRRFLCVSYRRLVGLICWLVTPTSTKLTTTRSSPSGPSRRSRRNAKVRVCTGASLSQCTSKTTFNGGEFCFGPVS